MSAFRTLQENTVVFLNDCKIHPPDFQQMAAIFAIQRFGKIIRMKHGWHRKSKEYEQLRWAFARPNEE
jgi:hypothetical protein